MKKLMASVGLLALSVGYANAQSCPPGPAPAYYVSSAGNDSNAGTSPTTPWKTIAKLSAAKLPANSCIHLMSDIAGNLVLDGANMAGPIGFDGGGFTLTALVGGKTAGDGGLGVQTFYGTGLTQGLSVFNLTIRPTTPWTARGFVVDNGTTGVAYNLDVGGASLPDYKAGTGNDAAYNVLLSGTNFTFTNGYVHGLNGLTSRDDIGIRLENYSGNIDATWNTIENIGGRSYAQGAANGYSGNGISIDWGQDACNLSGACTFNVDHNHIFNNARNVSNCGGPAGIIGYQVHGRLNIGWNYVHDIKPTNMAILGQPPSYACDFDGIDLDGNVTNAYVHDNYTTHNASAGYLAWIGDADGGKTWGPNTYTNNISVDDYQSGWGGAQYFSQILFATTGNVNGVVHFDNNQIWLTATGTSKSPVFGFSDSNQVGRGSTVSGNTVVMGGGAVPVQCNQTNDPRSLAAFSGNKYYGASFTVNCDGTVYSSFAAWQKAILGGEVGSTFLPLAQAPQAPLPPLLSQVGRQTGGVTPPPPPPPPPPVTTNFTVDTAVPATVSGNFTISGATGTSWVNVGLFNATGANVGTDVKPVNGKWTMVIDTTKLPVGVNTLAVDAFSVASGQPGGTSTALPLSLNVVRVAPPPPPPTPIQTALAALTADLKNATPTTKAHLAALTKLLVGK